MTADGPILEIDGLIAGYRGSRVLQGVSLSVPRGGVLAVLGRNGVGKSTLIMSIIGLLRPYGGHVVFDGKELVGRRPESIARLGVGLVPQGRRVFGTLSVEENLRIAVRTRTGDAWTVERVYDLLPRLAERRRQRAGLLSGGEQQMLALGRALVANPRLLLLDEPSDGLAPAITAQVAETIRSVRAAGLTVLLVEQDLSLALSVADEVAVIQKGVVQHSGSADEFERDPALARELLGVG